MHTEGRCAFAISRTSLLVGNRTYRLLPFSHDWRVEMMATNTTELKRAAPHPILYVV